MSKDRDIIDIQLLHDIFHAKAHASQHRAQRTKRFICTNEKHQSKHANKENLDCINTFLALSGGGKNLICMTLGYFRF
jgi:hypothetical protein